MNWLTQPLERVFLRPLRSLGGLSFDVVVSEEHEDTLTIAKHPVEQGANISDHAYRNPCKVVIRGASSESTYGLPVWDPYNATLYNALLALQNAREPFDIVTGPYHMPNKNVSYPTFEFLKVQPVSGLFL